jgi:dipeptidyl aminopeptidase/acylaminoacyl peptidase
MIKSLIVSSALLSSLNLNADTYKKPEALITNLLKADSFSRLSLNYQNTAGIKKYAQYSPSIEYVARPQLKLGGVRFNPENYKSISNAYTSKIVYFDLATKVEKEISFGEGAIIGRTAWTEDDKHLLVAVETPACNQLWSVSIPKLVKKQVKGVCLNDILHEAFVMIDENRVLLSARTKLQKKPLNIKKTTPVGPVVQESLGKVAQNRIYLDLLKNQQDENTFEDAIKSQLMIYNLKTSQLSKIGPEDAYTTFGVSPDRKNILIGKVLRPYSYAVPVDYFARQYEVWNLQGKKTHDLYKTGPFENVPIDGEVTGPRGLRWVPDEKATLLYVQALDGGNWKTKVDYRDEVFRLSLLANGKTKAQSFYKTKKRFAGISFLDRGLGVLINDYERDTKWLTVSLLKTENFKVKSEKLIFGLNEDDNYNNPGSAYRVLNKYNASVVAVATDDESIFLSGLGATPEGYRPFLNQFNLKTLTKKEIFRSAEKTFENFYAFLDDTKFDKFLTTFETNAISPRYNIKTITPEGLKSELLYADKNPFEVIAQLKKEVLKYKRNDGVELSGTLYYPLNYEEGKKYPLVIDAYPLEYIDAATAGQVRSSAYTFETPYRADVMYFALRGYAVLQGAQIPIIGPAETKNDTFLPQLIAGAEAAIKAVNERKLIDPKKVGVIGHSYGAFMVANLLTHTDLFAAGIARSGAYNRTLTPFGFQGETRSFWEAKDLYLKLSPFYEAEKMKKPLLLIHGQADNNTGTFTMQSERYYEALKGQGAQVRLVLLPEESHSYAALESIEHVLYESFRWFDTYLKNEPTQK